MLTAYHPGGLAKRLQRSRLGQGDRTRQMIDQQADIIFGAGGNTGNGALLGGRRRRTTSVLGIGVDTDQ